MIVAASHLVTQLQSVISRNVNPLDSAVITIGKITGGTVQNIIAEKSRLGRNDPNVISGINESC